MLSLQDRQQHSVTTPCPEKRCNSILPHAVNCGRFCFWRRHAVVFLFAYEISQEPLNGFAPNLHGRWFLARISLKVKVKGQRSVSRETKTASLGPSVACVRFMFGKTFLPAALRAAQAAGI